jgi:hypothetical protein
LLRYEDCTEPNSRNRAKHYWVVQYILGVFFLKISVCFIVSKIFIFEFALRESSVTPFLRGKKILALKSSYIILGLNYFSLVNLYLSVKFLVPILVQEYSD